MLPFFGVGKEISVPVYCLAVGGPETSPTFWWNQPGAQSMTRLHLKSTLPPSIRKTVARRQNKEDMGV